MSKIHEALKRAQEERVQSVSAYERETEVWESEPAAPPEFSDRQNSTQLSESEPMGAFDLTDIAAPAEKSVPQIASAAVIGSEPVRQASPPPRIGSKREWTADPNYLVFSGTHAKSAAAEQFRKLCSRLYTIREASRLKTILVTSALLGEGKTFVASNIAQAIARDKKRRVLLIDADLRRSRLHVVFGAPLSPGLPDYLREQQDPAAIIQHREEENLFLITGGDATPHASELLSNGRMSSLIASVEEDFDWIIIDSPPCLPVADAGLLAGFCDGVLLVVRAGSTPAAVAQKARKELQKRNVIGAILNSVEGAENFDSSYGYGYGHLEVQAENSR